MVSVYDLKIGYITKQGRILESVKLAQRAIFFVFIFLYFGMYPTLQEKLAFVKPSPSHLVLL